MVENFLKFKYWFEVILGRLRDQINLYFFLLLFVYVSAICTHVFISSTPAARLCICWRSDERWEWGAERIQSRPTSQKRALLARRVGEDPTLRNREIERQSAMHAGQARGWLVGPDHLNSPPSSQSFWVELLGGLRHFHVSIQGQKIYETSKVWKLILFPVYNWFGLLETIAW